MPENRTLITDFIDEIPEMLYNGFEIKESYMPDEPINCIRVSMSTSGRSTKFFGQQNLVEYPVMEMTVRSEDYYAGHEVTKLIKKFFDEYHYNKFLHVYSNGNMAILGKDENGFRRFLAQFTLIVEE